MTDWCGSEAQNELSYFDSCRSQTVCLYLFTGLYFVLVYVGILHSAVAGQSKAIFSVKAA